MYFIKICDMKNYFLFLIAATILYGCDTGGTDMDKEAQNVATAFAEAYFNYDFQEARKLVTADSEKWLRFAATNISQEDVDILNAKTEAATVEVNDISYVDDTTSTVSITVNHFLLKDTLQRQGHIEDEAEYSLTIVRQGRKHLVRMACLPQNERRSHD